MAGTQGQIPGRSYNISEWSESRLGQWIQQNIHKYLPTSIQTADTQLETATISTAITLSPAAVTNLQEQLGLTGGSGSTWYAGVSASAAGLGANGDFYLNTTTDDISRKIGGAWVFQTNIKGAAGSAGATGPAGPTGPAGTPADISLIVALGD